MRDELRHGTTPNVGGVSISIGGDNNQGKIVTGHGHQVADVIHTGTGAVAAGGGVLGGVVGAAPEEVRAALRAQFRAEVVAPLERQVEAGAPAPVRDEAIRQVHEVADAITAPTPDLGRFERVRDWFVRHAPSVAGGVVSLVVHPLVGKLVEAAGDAAASQFREKFGAPDGR